jgi:hypothetical protein
MLHIYWNAQNWLILSGVYFSLFFSFSSFLFFCGRFYAQIQIECTYSLFLFTTLSIYFLRIQTSYVPVEPKRRPQQDSSKQSDISSEAVGAATAATITPPDLRREEQPSSSRKIQQGRKGAPLRRSRIIITVKRTVDYKQWLEENPHQAAGHGDDIEDSPS